MSAVVALKKPQVHIGAYVQDNRPHAAEAWALRKARIARQAEAAANLPGNKSTPDLEDFLGTSDFA